jgi:hypothetical protein
MPAYVENRVNSLLYLFQLFFISCQIFTIFIPNMARLKKKSCYFSNKLLRLAETESIAANDADRAIRHCVCLRKWHVSSFAQTYQCSSNKSTI